MITPQEHIQIRGWLNRFSDRWPNEYAHLFAKIADWWQFQLVILTNYYNLAKPDNEDAKEIWDLIQRLDQDRRKGKKRAMVEIEDISDGGL
jgi:hypothetical protein